MKMNNSTFNIQHSTLLILLILIVMGLTLLSCSDNKHPGYNYMPDMAYSVAHETYVHPDSADVMSAKIPVEGTIPRGYMPYHYKDTKEDYERAGREVKNPLPPLDDVIAEGGRLFNIYCAICHGEKGDGNGFIVANEKFPAVPPSYFEEKMLNMPEGQMFHSVTHGKNMMGSYASQLTVEERWKVITYEEHN